MGVVEGVGEDEASKRQGGEGGCMGPWGRGNFAS